MQGSLRSFLDWVRDKCNKSPLGPPVSPLPINDWSVVCIHIPLFFCLLLSEIRRSVYLPYLIMIAPVKPMCCNKATLHERERVGGSHGHHVSELLHLHYCSPFRWICSNAYPAGNLKQFPAFPTTHVVYSTHHCPQYY